MVIAKPLPRFAGAVFAFIYFSTHCVFAHAAESNFWRTRRQAALSPAMASAKSPGTPAADGLVNFPPLALLRGFSSAGPLPHIRYASHVPGGVSPAAQEVLSTLAPALPPLYGSIRQISFPADWGSVPADTNGGHRPLIVLQIQDVHRNVEAQENIGKTLQELVDHEQVDLIALEGASRPLDLDVFRSFEDKDLVRSTADHFLLSRKIPGPIHSALTSPTRMPPMIGVEDAERYGANVEAYKRSAPQASAFLKRASGIAAEMEKEKDAVLNPALRDFDRKASAYARGSGPLGDYLAFLSEKGVPAGNSVQAFLTALRLERSLDFKAVEKERAEILRALSDRLSSAETDALLDLSVSYRTGRTSHEDFYGRLESLSRGKGLSFEKYPAMAAYRRYVSLSNAIRAETLLDEIARMEEQTRALLTRTPRENDLLLKSRRLTLTEKLLRFALTPNEWREYRDGPRRDGPLAADLSSFESFYEEAERRNLAMAENLFTAVRAENDLSPDPVRPFVAVLVTGGFHSEEMARLLRQRGAGTVTFSPRLTRADPDDGGAALGVFAQEKTPLEKLFEGQKLFLSPDPYPPNMRVETAAVLVGAKAAGWPIERLTAQFKVFLGDLADVFSSIRLKKTRGGLRISLTRKDGVRQVFGINGFNLTSNAPIATPLLGILPSMRSMDLFRFVDGQQIHATLPLLAVGAMAAAAWYLFGRTARNRKAGTENADGPRSGARMATAAVLVIAVAAIAQTNGPAALGAVLWTAAAIAGVLGASGTIVPAPEAESRQRVLFDRVTFIDAVRSIISQKGKERSSKFRTWKNYPVVITDKDGTLIPLKGKLSPAMARRVLETLQAGSPFIILTANTMKSVQEDTLAPLLEELAVLNRDRKNAGLDELDENILLSKFYVAALSGAQIWKYRHSTEFPDPHTCMVIEKEYPMEPAVAEKLKGAIQAVIDRHTPREGNPDAKEPYMPVPAEVQGTQIDERMADLDKERVIQYTLKAPGLDLSKDLQKAYDPDKSKRQVWAQAIRDEIASRAAEENDPGIRRALENVTVEPGGTTSIDVRIGNKRTCVERLIDRLGPELGFDAHDIIYFGDEFYKNGGDSSLLDYVKLAVNVGLFSMIDEKIREAAASLKNIFINPEEKGAEGPDAMLLYLSAMVAEMDRQEFYVQDTLYRPPSHFGDFRAEGPLPEEIFRLQEIVHGESVARGEWPVHLISEAAVSVEYLIDTYGPRSAGVLLKTLLENTRQPAAAVAALRASPLVRDYETLLKSRALTGLEALDLKGVDPSVSLTTIAGLVALIENDILSSDDPGGKRIAWIQELISLQESLKQNPDFDPVTLHFLWNELLPVLWLHDNLSPYTILPKQSGRSRLKEQNALPDILAGLYRNTSQPGVDTALSRRLAFLHHHYMQLNAVFLESTILRRMKHLSKVWEMEWTGPTQTWETNFEPETLRLANRGIAGIEAALLSLDPINIPTEELENAVRKLEALKHKRDFIARALQNLDETLTDKRRFIGDGLKGVSQSCLEGKRTDASGRILKLLSLLENPLIHRADPMATGVRKAATAYARAYKAALEATLQLPGIEKEDVTGPYASYGVMVEFAAVTDPEDATDLIWLDNQRRTQTKELLLAVLDDIQRQEEHLQALSGLAEDITLSLFKHAKKSQKQSSPEYMSMKRAEEAHLALMETLSNMEAVREEARTRAISATTDASWTARGPLAGLEEFGRSVHFLLDFLSVLDEALLAEVVVPDSLAKRFPTLPPDLRDAAFRAFKASYSSPSMSLDGAEDKRRSAATRAALHAAWPLLLRLLKDTLAAAGSSPSDKTSVEELLKVLQNVFFGIVSRVDRDARTAHPAFEKSTSWRSEKTAYLVGALFPLFREAGLARTLDPDVLQTAALLGDFGEIFTPEEILFGAAQTAAIEGVDIKRQHVHEGADFFQTLAEAAGLSYDQRSALKTIEDVARFHHEKWSGDGYPAGLKGPSIPMAARLVSLAAKTMLTAKLPMPQSRVRELFLAALSEDPRGKFDPELAAPILAAGDMIPQGPNGPDLGDLARLSMVHREGQSRGVTKDQGRDAAKRYNREVRRAERMEDLKGFERPRQRRKHPRLSHQWQAGLVSSLLSGTLLFSALQLPGLWAVPAVILSAAWLGTALQYGAAQYLGRAAAGRPLIDAGLTEEEIRAELARGLPHFLRGTPAGQWLVDLTTRFVELHEASHRDYGFGGDLPGEIGAVLAQAFPWSVRAAVLGAKPEAGPDQILRVLEGAPLDQDLEGFLRTCAASNPLERWLLRRETRRAGIHLTEDQVRRRLMDAPRLLSAPRHDWPEALGTARVNATEGLMVWVTAGMEKDLAEIWRAAKAAFAATGRPVLLVAEDGVLADRVSNALGVQEQLRVFDGRSALDDDGRLIFHRLHAVLEGNGAIKNVTSLTCALPRDLSWVLDGLPPNSPLADKRSVFLFLDDLLKDILTLSLPSLSLLAETARAIATAA